MPLFPSLRLRSVLLATSVLLAASVVGISACNNSTSPTDKARTIAGESRTLGQGNAHSWVTLDAQGAPTALGITLSETALAGLPTTPMPGMPSAIMLSLPLPAEAKGSGFDHAEVDWNPLGHDPVQIYGAPHFDFHFYSVTDSAQKAILPSDPQFATKAGNLPGATFIPAGYVPPPGVASTSTVPMMGLHWTNVTSPELNGQAFTSTFILGSYDGKFIFVEPMITKAYLESHPSASFVVPQPAHWAGTGYFPASYSVTYDATAKEYRIVLVALTKRP